MKNPKLAQIEAGIEKNVPPQMMDAYNRIVAAGMKIMFSPQTGKKIFAGALQGDVPKRLSLITAAVISMINSESKGSMPKQPAIPAAATLLLNALDMAATAKAIKIDPQTVMTALNTLKTIIQQQLAIGSANDIKAQQGVSTQAATPQTQPVQQSQPQGGLINAAQGA